MTHVFHKTNPCLSCAQNYAFREREPKFFVATKFGFPKPGKNETRSLYLLFSLLSSCATDFPTTCGHTMLATHEAKRSRDGSGEKEREREREGERERERGGRGREGRERERDRERERERERKRGIYLSSCPCADTAVVHACRRRTSSGLSITRGLCSIPHPRWRREATPVRV